MGLEVLTQDGRAVGVLAWDILRGEVLFFEAKAVILATGGAHGLYYLNSGSSDLTGDGQAMASRAGAEMVDMEMVSFLPTTVLYPVMFRGNILPYILCTLGYGELVNGLGEPFVRVHYAGKMAEAALHSEWNKLLLSRAILAEMRTHPGEHGGAYFSMKKVAASEFNALRGRFPGLAQDPYKRMLDDLENGKDLEIAPAGHYFEGGIRVNSRCETSIPGLYAAGECSGGLFGANRVAAATTEMVVQGRIAGEEAAKFARVRGQATGDSGRLINACLRETFAAHATPPGDVLAARDRLRQLSALHLGLTRSVAGLEVLQGELRQLRDLMGAGPVLAHGSRYDLVSLVRLTLRNMIDCADLMCRASRAREESRGVFFRSDFPTTDNDRFLQHVVQARAANDVRTSMEDIAVTSVKLPRGRFSYEEYLAKVVEQA
jgi:succinate dehydrogenase/fumarate reductase flavoprotein subunit